MVLLVDFQIAFTFSLDISQNFNFATKMKDNQKKKKKKVPNEFAILEETETLKKKTSVGWGFEI